ncbi:hypothetical protein M9458_005177, partial [Cirrhinus mrigala]
MSTALATVVVRVECECTEKIPTPCTTGGEQTQASGDYVDEYADMPCLLPPDELSEYPKIPSNLPLPPPPGLCVLICPSPAGSCQPTIYGVGLPWVCQSPSASELEDPLTLPPESQTLPRPNDPKSPPWLLAPSPPAPLGSLVPPALPWLVVNAPLPQDLAHLAVPHCSIPPAPSTLILSCSGSTMDLRISIFASVARALGSTLALWILGVTLARDLCLGFHHHLLRRPLESAALPSPWLLPL